MRPLSRQLTGDMKTDRIPDRWLPEAALPLALALLIPLAALLALSGVARAAPPAAPMTTFVVTKTDDTNDGTCAADCSLREAVTAAQAIPGPDTITFDLPTGSTILLGGNQLRTITDTLTIDGSTADNLTVSGDGASRILEIGSGTAVTITNLTFADGYATGTFLEDGGAIYNDGGILTVSDSAFRDNWTEGYGGAIENELGTVILNNVTFERNTAVGHGGGVRNTGVLTVTNAVFEGNSADQGGGVAHEGNRALVATSTFSGNVASDYGGGIYNEVPLTITGSHFFSNTAPDGGGILNEYAGLTIEDTTFSANSAGGDGGAVHNRYDSSLAINRTTFDANSASDAGGAIYNTDNSTVTLRLSTLSANESIFRGGAIYNFSVLTVLSSTLDGNASQLHSGGAIYNYGTATVRSSSFSGNTAYLDGGAVRTIGAFAANNSTFSGNSARADGGAIYNVTIGDEPSTLVLRNNTFTLNAAGDEGGGLHNVDGELHLSNNIIANSLTGGDCVNAGATGAIVVNVANLVEDGTCAADFSGDPLLGPLQDNGGPTLTHALPTDSPAVDAGNNAVCALPGGANNRDQRGFPRPADGNRDDVAVCDIGAFELQPEWTVAVPLILKGAP